MYKEFGEFDVIDAFFFNDFVCFLKKMKTVILSKKLGKKMIYKKSLFLFYFIELYCKFRDIFIYKK